MSDLSFGSFVGLAALGVLAAVAVIVAVWLLTGLFHARSLLRRELSAYFLSPIAYVMLVVFLLVAGYRFSWTLEHLTRTGPRGIEYPMQYFFSILPPSGWRSSIPTIAIKGIFGGDVPEEVKELLSGVAFWVVYLLIPALLTMRLFAEERSTGTLEMLMTAPLRDWQVVLSKYLACFLFYIILWVPTLVYLPVLLNLHGVQFHPSWTPWSILMVGGLGAVVLAVLSALPSFGTAMRLVSLVLLWAGAASAIVGGWFHYHHDPGPRVMEVTAGGNIDPWPVLASYLGLVLAGAMFLALGILVSSLVRSQMVAALLTVVLSLGLLAIGLWRPQHFSQDFGRGLIDTRYVVFYISMALFCLFLTVRSLEMRRWR
ncbi:MAG TPA: ABC transporter permease [Gemmataceae bacterium]|nr:ABC transporter permease [Gemmataceae bacterium]